MTTTIKDGNDAKVAGASVADLVQAAQSNSPILGLDRARAAQAGLDAIGALEVEVRRAQTTAAAMDMLVQFMADETKTWPLAIAWCERETEVRAALMALEGQRGLRRNVMELRAVIRKFVKSVRQQEAERKEQRETSPTVLNIRIVTEELGLTGLKLPPGWTLSEDGLSNTDDVVSRWPILISGVLRDVSTGAYKLKVSWRRGDKWEDTVVERDVLMTARRMEALINAGAPVSSNVAAALVSYFSAFEVENLTRLPEARASTHMGWIGKKSFLYGRDSLGADQVVLTEVATEQCIVDSVGCRGSWEGWLRTAWTKYILPRPMVQVGVYAAMASFLLEPLELQGFVLDYSGLTSVGKTTSMRAIASAFGVPDEDVSGVVQSWASAKHSVFAHMRKAYIYQSFPLMLDDTKHQRDTPDNVATMLYAHPSGQQRAQGNPSSTLRAKMTWRSVLISTGEAPITSFTNDGGAQARAIVVRGNPWGEVTTENAQSASQAKFDFLENYGHLGRRFVMWLLTHQEDWPRLRERFEAYRHSFTRAVKGGPEARLYEHVALVKLAAMMCHEKLGLTGEWAPAVAVLEKAIKDAAKTIDVPRRALDAVVNWIFANQAKFYMRTSEYNAEPHSGWAGMWEGADMWEEINIDPSIVDMLLEKFRYDGKAVISAWRERGWLRMDKDGMRYPSCRKFYNRRLMPIKRSAIEEPDKT